MEDRPAARASHTPRHHTGKIYSNNVVFEYMEKVNVTSILLLVDFRSKSKVVFSDILLLLGPSFRSIAGTSNRHPVQDFSTAFQ